MTLQRKPRKMIALECDDCGMTFERRADSATRAADSATRCTECSYAKRGSNLSGKTVEAYLRGSQVVCAQCGTMVYKKRSVQERTSIQFCDRDCQIAYQRVNGPPPALIRSHPNNRGERNARFKTGKFVGKNKGAGNKPVVRVAVAERDGNWCLFCGATGPGLHLHRVVYGSHGGVYEATNCVQLCNEHHALVHSSKRTWQPKLVAHLSGDEPIVGGIT